MSPKFILQTMLLLFLAQLLLGGVGLYLADALPWLGLAVTVFLLWLIYRLALVFRAEAAEALKRAVPVSASRLAVFAALGVQLPALLLLPFWAPGWIVTLWQGAMLPVPATLGLLWPQVAAVGEEWIWLAFLLEMGLFTWAAGRPAVEKTVHQAAPLKAPAGEWVAARRLSDINRKGRRVK